MVSIMIIIEREREMNHYQEHKCILHDYNPIADFEHPQPISCRIG